MPFRFTIDSQLYDLVDPSQSGEVVHRWKVPLRQRHDIERFISKLLEQNEAQLPELKRFLGLSSGQEPQGLLNEQIEKGQLLVQKGTTASGGGAAKAPTGTSPYRAPRAESKLFSNPLMRQMMGVDGASSADTVLNGAAVLSELLGSYADTESSATPITTTAQTQGAAPPTSSSSSNKPKYKMCIEVAGSARCQKQKLEISQLNSGEQTGERAQAQTLRVDNQARHRSLVEFKSIPNAPRDLTLLIATSGPGGPLRLPLVSGHPTSDEQTSKGEWDTVIVPVKPLGYINKNRNRQQADLLKPGFVYVFWNNTLWRELEVGRNQSLRDINVEYHRGTQSVEKREAEGHWLSEVWVPYKLNGADQSGNLVMLYSEVQLDWPYLQSLENDPTKLQAKGTGLSAISQYSSQKQFANDQGDVGDIASALLDQQIDPASGYQVISEQGRHLKRARSQNIPTAYLTPLGEKFVLQIEDSKGNPFRDKPFTLEHANGTINGVTDSQGLLEVFLEEPITEANITLSLDDPDTPSHQLTFKTEGDILPDVSTVKGQQLRLNNLGYNAGVVDGLMGRKTRSAAKGFQKDNHLDVDGIIGPKTQAQLTKVYGQ